MNNRPSQDVVGAWFRAGIRDGKKIGAKKENKRLRKLLRANYVHQVSLGNESLADGIDFAINVIWSHKPKGKNK